MQVCVQLDIEGKNTKSVVEKEIRSYKHMLPGQFCDDDGDPALASATHH